MHESRENQYVQEGGNVLSHLTGSGRSTVGVFHKTIEQNTGHGNLGAGEEGVVVQTFLDVEARRGVTVARQQREDVVSTAVAGFDDQTQVWRKRTGVTCTGGLLVGVGRREIVRQLTRALEHLTIIVGPIGVLDLGSHRLSLVNGVRNTDQVAPGNTRKGVAGAANLLVHLETTTNRRMVERVEPARVRPIVRRGVQALFSRAAGTQRINKGKLAVHLLVPGDRAEREDCSSNSRRARSESRLKG